MRLIEATNSKLREIIDYTVLAYDIYGFGVTFMALLATENRN